MALLKLIMFTFCVTQQFHFLVGTLEKQAGMYTDYVIPFHGRVLVILKLKTTLMAINREWLNKLWYIFWEIRKQLKTMK